MALVTVKSTIISNRDSQPIIHNSDYFDKGMVRESVAAVSCSTGDSSGSEYIFFSIPSNARLSSLSLYSDALGTGTSCQIGLWNTTLNGGAVVSANLFASGLSLVSAVAGVNQQFQAGVAGASHADAIGKRIWELLGLSADPFIDYDVALQMLASVTAGGTLAMKATYCI